MRLSSGTKSFDVFYAATTRVPFNVGFSLRAVTVVGDCLIVPQQAETAAAGRTGDFAQRQFVEDFDRILAMRAAHTQIPPSIRCLQAQTQQAFWAQAIYRIFR